MVLADTSNPSWADALRFLPGHPATAQLMLETFQETLARLGVEPSGTDPVTGEPRFLPGDVT